MRLLYFTDFSEQFPYRLLRGIYRYGQQNNIQWVVMAQDYETLIPGIPNITADYKKMGEMSRAAPHRPIERRICANLELNFANCAFEVPACPLTLCC